MLNSFLEEINHKLSVFSFQNEAMVKIHVKPEKIGKITEINNYGLSFFCVSSKKTLNSFQYIDIFLKNDNFFLNNIKITINSLKNMHTFNYRNSIHILSYNVGFHNLSKYQQNNLKYFISNVSIGNRNNINLN